MAKIYGENVTTGTYEARFVYLNEKDSRGKFSIELLVPIEEAKILNKKFYGDNQKLIDHNKKTAKAKVPKVLYNYVNEYDDEAKEVVLDDEGEAVKRKDVVKFTFKSMFAPKIQFKKGLDTSAKIGAGSKVQVVASAFGGTAKTEDGLVDYVLLQLKGVRVLELVTYEAEEVFEDGDDEFEDATITISEGESQDKPAKNADPDDGNY